MHAQHQTAVACGILPGILQPASMVWADAQHVATGISAIQSGRSLTEDADADLWRPAFTSG